MSIASISSRPTPDETLAILRGIRSRYEEHHKLQITDEALEAATRMATRYVPDRFLPDKAIDLVDEAASRVRVFKVTRAKPAPSPDLAPAVASEDAALQSSLGLLPEAAVAVDAEEAPLQVTADDIAEIVSMWTGVPVIRIAQEESVRLLDMEDTLHQRIVGQHEAISVLARSVRRARAGLKDPRRPIGSFIFLGPTGVGKTELCKALAEFMFGSEEALIQLDMSEFMERHTVSRLVGAPPGYVGYDEAGQLTEALRRRPYSVVCFDEFEKAHPEAFNMLLQIMEDGHLSDAKGHKVDFGNAIVIMTSNVGSGLISQNATLGFGTSEREGPDSGHYREIKSRLTKELKRLFKPEFLNRVDEVVVFHELSRENIDEIVDIQLHQLNVRLEEQDITVQCTPEGREQLVVEGYDPQFGARPLRRAIQRNVEDALAEKMLEGVFGSGDLVLIDAEDGKIVLRAGDVIGEAQSLLAES